MVHLTFSQYLLNVKQGIEQDEPVSQHIQVLSKGVTACNRDFFASRKWRVTVQPLSCYIWILPWWDWSGRRTGKADKQHFICGSRGYCCLLPIFWVWKPSVYSLGKQRHSGSHWSQEACAQGTMQHLCSWGNTAGIQREHHPGIWQSWQDNEGESKGCHTSLCGWWKDVWRNQLQWWYGTMCGDGGSAIPKSIRSRAYGTNEIPR